MSRINNSHSLFAKFSNNSNIVSDFTSRRKRGYRRHQILKQSSLKVRHRFSNLVTAQSAYQSLADLKPEDNGLKINRDNLSVDIATLFDAVTYLSQPEGCIQSINIYRILNGVKNFCMGLLGPQFNVEIVSPKDLLNEIFTLELDPVMINHGMIEIFINWHQHNINEITLDINRNTEGKICIESGKINLMIKPNEVNLIKLLGFSGFVVPESKNIILMEK
jgi:hypothetical protein